MKKLSWILIITLLASCLSACGRKETVIYQGDTASTSDATDDPIRNLDYTVPGDKGTLTVQAQVDTSLAEKNAPVASLSRADFTDADIQTYADLLFDEGSYSLFMPYEFRSIEDLSAACSAWEDTFKSYEDFSTIPEYMIAEYYDATDTLSGKQHDTDAAKRVVETDGEIKWYNNSYSERDAIGQFISNQFCIIDGTISKEHYYLAFLNPLYSVSNMISSVGTFDEKTDVYIGRNLKKGKRHLDPTEFIEIVRVPMEEAREMIYSGKIVDSKTIVAILAYYDKKSRGIFK